MESSRTLAVKVLSGFYGVVDRASRAVGMEREHIEDLMAEARAHYEASRARAARARQDGPEEREDRPRASAGRPPVHEGSAPKVHDSGSAPKPPASVVSARERAA